MFTELLLIDSFIGGDMDTFRRKALVLVIIWTVVAIAIMIDLFVGLSKAKKSGTLKTSYGLRRTVNKVTEYYGLMTFALLADILFNIIVPNIYPFSVLGGGYLVYIEFLSVQERQGDKDRRKLNKHVEDYASMISALTGNPEKLKGLAEFLKEKAKEDDNDKAET